MLVDINLLPDKERERSTFVIAALAIIGAALLVWIGFFVAATNLSKEIESLNHQQATVLQSQEDIRTNLQVSQSLAAKKQLEATIEWAEAYQLDTVPVIKETISLLPKRGFFRNVDFTETNLAVLTVQFDTKTEAAHYLTRLQSSDVLTNASITSIIAEELDNVVEKALWSPIPRYIAEYSIQLTDSRLQIEGTAETTEEVIPEVDDEGGGNSEDESE